MNLTYSWLRYSLLTLLAICATFTVSCTISRRPQVDRTTTGYSSNGAFAPLPQSTSTWDNIDSVSGSTHSANDKDQTGDQSKARPQKSESKQDGKDLEPHATQTLSLEL